jgi:hypothetical protein
MSGKTIFITLFLTLFVFGGCNSTHQVEVKPVEIKPIHITIDVNVEVAKASDDFFDDIDKAEDKIKIKLGEGHEVKKKFCNGVCCYGLSDVFFPDSFGPGDKTENAGTTSCD